MNKTNGGSDSDESEMSQRPKVISDLSAWDEVCIEERQVQVMHYKLQEQTGETPQTSTNSNQSPPKFTPTQIYELKIIREPKLPPKKQKIFIDSFSELNTVTNIPPSSSQMPGTSLNSPKPEPPVTTLTPQTSLLELAKAPELQLQESQGTGLKASNNPENSPEKPSLYEKVQEKKSAEAEMAPGRSTDPQQTNSKLLTKQEFTRAITPTQKMQLKRSPSPSELSALTQKLMRMTPSYEPTYTSTELMKPPKRKKQKRFKAQSTSTKLPSKPPESLELQQSPDRFLQSKNLKSKSLKMLINLKQVPPKALSLSTYSMESIPESGVLQETPSTLPTQKSSRSLKKSHKKKRKNRKKAKTKRFIEFVYSLI